MYRVRIPIGLGLLAFLGAVFYIDHSTASNYATAAVVIALTLGALWEFFGLAERRNYQPYKYSALLATIAFLGAQLFARPYLPQVTFGLCLLLFLKLFRSATDDKAVENFALTLMGLVYISYLLGHYTLLVRDLGDGLAGVYYLCLIVLVSKSMDIGGYLVGVKFGKHKICPSISPKKSVEGSGGGVALAIGVAFLLCHYFPVIRQGLPLWYHALGFAVVIGSFSLFGDLCESLVKRRCEAKDSGNLLPEFGGALDIVDSVLFTMPLGYYFLSWTVS